MTSAGERDEIEAGELAFAREDARLPWLEADDDYEEPGVPASRMVAFVLAALVVLAAIIGGGYWLLARGWQTLTGRHEALQGVNHRVVQGTVDGSTVYRLQAVAGSTAAARELCSELKANGADCQVKN